MDSRSPIIPSGGASSSSTKASATSGAPDETSSKGIIGGGGTNDSKTHQKIRSSGGGTTPSSSSNDTSVNQLGNISHVKTNAPPGGSHNGSGAGNGAEENAQAATTVMEKCSKPTVDDGSGKKDHFQNQQPKASNSNAKCKENNRGASLSASSDKKKSSGCGGGNRGGGAVGDALSRENHSTTTLPATVEKGNSDSNAITKGHNGEKSSAAAADLDSTKNTTLRSLSLTSTAVHTAEGDQFTAHLPVEPSSPSKKKKKKNKKKKRKTSNADSNSAVSGSGANASSKEDVKGGGNNGTVDVAVTQGEKKELVAPSITSNKSLVNEKITASSSSTSKGGESGGAGATLKDAHQQPKASSNNREHQEKKGKIVEKVPSPSSSSSEQTSNATADKATTKEAKSAPSNSNSNQDDADDGAWETVEVKPRGRKAKSQGNNNNNGNNGSSNSNNNNVNNHGKGGNANNGNRANNNSGRNNDGNNSNSNNNNGNSDVATSSNNNNNNNNSSQNNNGQNNNNSRRKKDGRRRKKNNNNNQNQQQQKNDNVGDGKGGGGGKSSADGGAKSSSDNNHQKQQQRGRSSSHNNDKRTASSSGNNNNNNGNNKQQGRRSNATATAVATNPPPLATSKHNGKSMRDVLLGASAASAATAGGKATDSSATALAKSKNADQQPKSAKVKPGISYKSAIEPVKKELEQLAAPTNNASKPKPNAWAKVVKSASAASLSAISNASAVGNDTVTEKKEGAMKTNDSVKPETKVVLESIPPKATSIPKAAVPPASTVPTKIVSSPTSSENNEKETDGGDEDAAAAHGNNVPPPLDTLLGPGNSCSATSSVASSLDAPHGARPEDDVGYHLLNVCGQLSEELNTFMSRRSLALDVRRRERNAVLGALQDTLGKIWPDQCRVEMYGSCATQLDLPSSDLDLVVCGLDDVMNHPPPSSPMEQQRQESMQSMNMPGPGSFNEGEMKRQESMGVTEEGIPVSPDQHSTTATVATTVQGDVSSPTASVQKNASSPGLFSGSNISEHVPSVAAIQDDSAHCSEDMEFHRLDSSDSYSQAYQPGPSMESYTTDYQGGSGEFQGQQQDVGMENYNPEYQGSQHEFYYAPYNYAPHLSLNAQRVLRLASELELQPWAVQVKAIPTATVPVVKMLADPSRLPGFAGGSGDNWMMQQQMSPQGAISSSPPLSSDQMPHQASVSSSAGSGFFPQWRGADLMNGLQPIDITFEGPEHGGIGSTTYSQCVVQDACNETGLPPESTPVVQVAMVLKELLAQRRLNEPFSGGLSSYGLLLLLLAVLKDRKIIQEDMKKMEKQREKVSGDDTQRNKGKRQRRETSDGQGKVIPSSTSESIGQTKTQDAPSTTSKPTVSSSWASIAKKSNGNGSTTETYSMTLSTNESGANYSQTAQKQNKEMDKPQMLTEEGEAAEEVDGSSILKSQMIPQSSSVALDNAQAVLSQVTPSSDELPTSSTPQSSNDVFEVLCSGELTSGKLLMHFLLFYGQHFDAQATLIDLNATHHAQYGKVDVERLSAFIPRPPGGNIDPVTGMFSVDPLVVYDPLEGEIDYNVSKRCYCWNNVRWVFAQCYMTVSSIVETGDTAKTSLQVKHTEAKSDAKATSDRSCTDIVTPILELLLSF